MLREHAQPEQQQRQQQQHRHLLHIQGWAVVSLRLAESLWGMGVTLSPTNVTYLTGKRQKCE